MFLRFVANIQGSNWLWFNIGLDNGLVPSGNKPLTESELRDVTSPQWKSTKLHGNSMTNHHCLQSLYCSLSGPKHAALVREQETNCGFADNRFRVPKVPISFFPKCYIQRILYFTELGLVGDGLRITKLCLSQILHMSFQLFKIPWKAAFSHRPQNFDHCQKNREELTLNCYGCR